MNSVSATFHDADVVQKKYLNDRIVQLYHRFHRPLMSYFLRRTRNRSDSEDLTQQVFLRLSMGAGRVEFASPKAFVFKVASNLLLDYRRAMTRAGGTPIALDAEDTDYDMVGSETRTPEQILAGRQDLQSILACLEELEERTKSMFLLFRLEGMRHKEIGLLYGCSASTVEKHVVKATMHLALKFGAGSVRVRK